MSKEQIFQRCLEEDAAERRAAMLDWVMLKMFGELRTDYVFHVQFVMNDTMRVKL